MGYNKNYFKLNNFFFVLRWIFIIFLAGVLYYEPITSQLTINEQTLTFLFIFAVTYVVLAHIFLFLIKRKITRSVFVLILIIMDFISAFWLISLSDGVLSPFVPIIYLFLLNSGYYYKKLGNAILVILSIVVFTLIGIYIEQFYVTNNIWTYGIHIVVFLFIGLLTPMISSNVNKDKKKKLKFNDESLKDPITDLYNHRSFHNTLNKLMKTDKDFSLILVDIDDFDDINNHYDYAIGDQVLMTLGHTFTYFEDRSKYYSFRYGGEEFAIIMFETNRKAIEKQIIQWNDLFKYSVDSIPELNKKEITLSYGVADKEKSDTKQTLLSRAEKHLELAKQSGKNRTIFNNEVE